MSNTLFRQKSLDRISSPEELHDYMRVTSPRLWMILVTIVVLLAGFIIYASTATMENTMPIRVSVESVVGDAKEGEERGKTTWVSATLPLAQKDYLQTGMLLRLGGETGRIDWIGTTADSESVNILFDMDHDYFPLPTGEYDAVLVLETTTPISFLWN